MKNSKSFLKSFLIVLTAVFAAALFVSCPGEPEPELSKPVVSLKLSEKDPQTKNQDSLKYRRFLCLRQQKIPIHTLTKPAKAERSTLML